MSFTKLGTLGVVCFLTMAMAHGEPVFQILHKFFPDATGYSLTPWLAAGEDGCFYGTFYYGSYSGDVGHGDVFKMSPAGEVATVFSFHGTNGSSPAGLTLGDDGSFYGVTSSGPIGPNTGYGTIFKLTTNGVLTTLFIFRGTNGASPSGTLAKGDGGRFYGLTQYGGKYARGTAYCFATNGEMTLLYSFNTNSGSPIAGLTRGPDGSLYGTSRFGGNNSSQEFTGLGSVFKITTNGVFTTLISFGGTNGSNPFAGVTLGTDQNFYGTTSAGGAFGPGTLFRMTDGGVLTTLFSFNGTNGHLPAGPVTEGSDGNYYGLTAYRTQGTNSLSYGTVFQLSTNGNLRTVINMDGTNGRNPFAHMIRARDGNLYGVMLDVARNLALDGSFASIFRLVEPPILGPITWSNGAVKLTWTAFTNGAYRVEYKEQLGSSEWHTLASNITATAKSASYTDIPPAAFERYYRVVLLP